MGKPDNLNIISFQTKKLCAKKHNDKILYSIYLQSSMKQYLWHYRHFLNSKYQSALENNILILI